LAIIVSKNGKEARRIERTSFEREDALQKYLSENPAAIPIEDIKNQSSFFVLDREFPVTSGFIDILGTDGDGDIYVIETKLYKNPDKRYVLSQVLDYGAAIWRGGPENFISRLESRFRSRFDQDLSSALRDRSMNADLVKNNIRASITDSSIKFVILMDNVPTELKDLIMFMNQNSKFSIYLIELEYYKIENNEIMIPHVFGEEVVKTVGPPSTRVKVEWDEVSFLSDFEKRNGVMATHVARAIIEWAKPRVTEIYWGEGTTMGSFVPILVKNGIRYQLFALRSDGWIELYFQHYVKKAPLDSIEVRRDLMRRLNLIDGANLKEISLDRRPSIDVEILIKDVGLNRFLDAYGWIIGLIES
jgi:hypothetical protein